MSSQTTGQKTWNGQTLRREIERKGLTHEEVAVALDVGARTIGRWCSGKITPHRGNARRLARLLERDELYFYGPLPFDDDPDPLGQAAA